MLRSLLCLSYVSRSPSLQRFVSTVLLINLLSSGKKGADRRKKCTKKGTGGVLCLSVSRHNTHHSAINSLNSLIPLWLWIQAEACQPEVASVISQVIISCALVTHHLGLQPPVQMGPNNSSGLTCLTPPTACLAAQTGPEWRFISDVIGYLCFVITLITAFSSLSHRLKSNALKPHTRYIQLIHLCHQPNNCFQLSWLYVRHFLSHMRSSLSV